MLIRRFLRYQRSNQNPYIEEKQKTQWPKEKVQKNKQRSTKHTYKTKDIVTGIPLKTGKYYLKSYIFFNYKQIYNRPGTIRCVLLNYL